MKYDHINILCHMKLVVGHSCRRRDGACDLIAEEADLILASDGIHTACQRLPSIGVGVIYSTPTGVI